MYEETLVDPHNTYITWVFATHSFFSNKLTANPEPCYLFITIV